MDDAELVQRASTGDKEAFAHVYDRYAGRLHEFLWWVLQDRAEADDALYQTFLDAGARIHELGDPAQLRPWLFAIASRQALHNAPRRLRAEDTPLVAAGERTTWRDLVHVVQAVGEDLSRRDRALLDLRHRQGLADDDLGAAIGSSPDAAAALVEKVTERVEAKLADTVVAYLGQQDCPELQDALGEFDGRLTERQRQIVEQHVEECERCGARAHKHVAATALLRVTPPAPLPPDVTTRVIDDVQLATHAGRPWSARRNGFPPPLAADDRRRWGVAVAAALVLLLGALALIATRDDGGKERVAAVGSTVAAPTSSVTTRLTTTTLAGTTSSSTTPDGGTNAGAPATPATTRAPAGGGSSGGGSAGGGSSGGGSSGGGSSGGGSSGGGGGGSSDTTTTTEPPVTTTTTTEPPDSTGPALTGLSVSPSAIRPGGQACSNGDPTTATVSVNATDPSGVASVSATYAGVGGGGAVALGPSGGGTYTATLGPFESPVVPGDTSFRGSVIVTAKDGAGNSSSTSTDLILRCTKS